MIRRIYFLAILLVLGGWVSTRAQRLVVDLSGVWQSSLGECHLPGTTDENRLGSGEHPTNVTSQLTRLFPFVGKVTYERDIDIPEWMVGARRQLFITLERTKTTTLWIDGERVESVCNLYVPHCYALPNTLKAGRHHIKIEVDNSDGSVPEGVRGSHAWTDATQTNWNGILGKMELVSLPPTYIDWMGVYPNVEMNEVKVKMVVCTTEKPGGTYRVELSRNVYDDEDASLAVVSEKVKTEGSRNEVEFTIDMGENPHLWSEFHPDLYTLTAKLTGKTSTDSVQTTFGMRKFETEGTQFVVNGNKTFLRGTHDACVFPLKAYCPTDVDEWRRLFIIAKQYGINHYRFHSYTPTEAAFRAADEVGIYLHCELPLWGSIDSTTVDQNKFLTRHGMDVLREFGNHPSFMSMGLGNELWGDTDMMARWIDEFREQDPRHLYSQGSNNDLGWKGPKYKKTPDGETVPAEDMYITCRVGNGDGFTTHARTSFSFADADEGGILNWNRPQTDADFSGVVAKCQVPIVSHETCQFQIYPDYRDIPKYTGVLYPYNLEIFRDRLKENGLTAQIDAFHWATGKWAVDCYKADMEYCMRTPGFGGYQLLDIKDYPGQGSALCGILDAFMDSKGLVEPATFRGWNAPVVPMARMKSYCWSSSDTLNIDLVMSNYTEDDYRTPLTWELFSVNNDGEKTSLFSRSGEVDFVEVWQGDVEKVGSINEALSSITHSTQLRLELRSGKYSNYYNVWVYVADTKPRGNSVVESDTMDAETLGKLRKGRTVLLTPRGESIEAQSVGGLFTPDYWNYAMFKTISENNKRPVSPGTLGMLMNPSHPLFEHFPTEGRSDWQWWSIALHSRPLILNSLTEYRPIIQTVDNVERNHKLGILMEFKVGKGKLLICTTDLKAVSEWVEGKAFADAVRRYAESNEFNPETVLTEQELRSLLQGKTKVRDIQGVKNITDYEPAAH